MGNRSKVPWRFAVAPPLGLPSSQTLRESYIAPDRWIFEVEKLITDGLARLRANRDDRDGAILLGEALRRLEKERKSAKLVAGDPGPLRRFFKRGRTPKEAHVAELTSMAMGALFHFGWTIDWPDREMAIVTTAVLDDDG